MKNAKLEYMNPWGMNTPSLFTQVTYVYDDKLKWTLDEALGGGHKQAQLVLWSVVMFYPPSGNMATISLL